MGCKLQPAHKGRHCESYLAYTTTVTLGVLKRDEILTDFAKDAEFSLDPIVYLQGHPWQSVKINAIFE